MAISSIVAKQVAAQAATNIGSQVISGGPFGRGTDYAMNLALPNRLPEPGDLITLFRRGEITAGNLFLGMKAHGFDEEHAGMLIDASTVRPGFGEYLSLYRRGEVTRNELNLKAQEVGIDVDTVDTFIKSSEYIPSAQDAIRFAVREVYSDSAQQLGLFSDYPGEKFTLAAEANGMSEETAKLFWAAHWDLPSPTQVFEMLHRRLITPEQVDDYLKAADYAPPWRELMKNISYNTLTRVDVRRAYSLGILTADDVYNAYRDGGYDDKNATILRDFVIQDVSDENNGLTKSLITSSYKKSLIDRETALGMYNRLDIPTNNATLLLDLADYELKLELLESAESSLTEKYLEGSMTIEDVRDAVRMYDVSENYVTKLLNNLSLQKFKNSKKPTVADLKRWLQHNLISEELFINKLIRYGYSKEDAIIYSRETVVDNTIAGGA